MIVNAGDLLRANWDKSLIYLVVACPKTTIRTSGPASGAHGTHAFHLVLLNGHVGAGIRPCLCNGWQELNEIVDFTHTGVNIREVLANIHSLLGDK